MLAQAARGDAFDPPPDYYSQTTGTGATLKAQLNDRIRHSGSDIISYNDLRTILQWTDADPDNPDHILLVYDRVSLDLSDVIDEQGIPGWDSGESWDREHTWPRSRGVFSSGPDNSDLFNVRPSTRSVNSDRGNRNFGGVYDASLLVSSATPRRGCGIPATRTPA